MYSRLNPSTNKLPIIEPLEIYMRYWASKRSRWLDIGQVLSCIFINQDEVEVNKNAQQNEENRAIFAWPWNENARIKQTQQTIGRLDWFIERIKTRMAIAWLSERSGEKTSCLRTSGNQPILRFDVILQHDWPIGQCLLHIRVFFGRKTNRPCFDSFIHWLTKQKKNTSQTIFYGHTKISLSSHLDRTRLGNKGFNIWPKRIFTCGTNAGNPEQAR